MRYGFLFLLVMGLKVSAQPVAALDSLFGSYFIANEPGGAVLLVKDNKIVYSKGFGIADIQTKEPITPSTLFNIGSITKTFVAYGILKLAKEKKLSLDDDLDKYFPDFITASIAKKVKIVHLLTHTSGLPDSRKTSEQREFYLVAKDSANFAPLKQTKELEFEPGTRYKYSNPAFNGLALIIEKVTGEKWQDYIKKNIFQPAGMINSTITDGPHPSSGVAHAYERFGQKGLLGLQLRELDYGEEPTFAAAGNGGVWSSVEELWKYEQAIQQFRFLDKEAITRSRKVYSFPNWKDSLPSNLGLSWFTTKEMNLDMTGHTGTQGGFYADYCWLPEKKVFYVMLCNIAQPRKEIRAKLFSLLDRYAWLE